MRSPYLNAIYSVLSYGMKRYAGISLQPPLPPAINIELSSRCNLSCPECVTGAGLLRRENDFIDYSLAAKIAAELSGRTLSAWLYFQGEPMLHPRIFDIIRLFRRMRPVISTNGHFLDMENCRMLADSALRKIIISYDGATPATYKIYRIGGDHSRVTDGIRRLDRAIMASGSKVRIELQFLLHRHNQHEVPEAAAFARSVNAAFSIKSMQVLDAGRAGDWMPGDGKRSRYKKSDGQWKPARSLSRGCFRMWTTAIVTVDGDVVPCCFDKYNLYSMGKINDRSFGEIWNSEKYKSFRESVMRNRASVDICGQCPQGRRIIFNA
jgi:radical SAM protein with 4Fe4S-binding SPASM domain